MEQQPVPASIYDKPKMFMGQEAGFNKALIDRPQEHKGRVCYCTGFYTTNANGDEYLEVHTNHAQDTHGKPVFQFIAASKMRDKNVNSIPFAKVV